MKASSYILLTAATTLGTSSLFGFAEFARGEFLLSTTARTTYDSRVLGGLNSSDDYIFSLEPRLIYRREAGQLKFEGNLGARISRYAEYDHLNSEDALALLRLRLPSDGASLPSGQLEVSYSEETDVNYDVNTRIREKTFQAKINSSVPLGLKTGFIFGASYRDDQRTLFSDRETWDGMAGFRYGDFLHGSSLELTYRHREVESTGRNSFGIPIDQRSDVYQATFSRPLYHNIRASFGYGYRILHRSRAETVTGEHKSEGSIISVNIVGPFLPESMFPKIESSLSLGYQQAETPGLNDTGGETFVGRAHVSWQARERTRIFVEARRSLELSVNDFTMEVTAFEIGVSQSIGNFIQAAASIGHDEREFRSLNRSDRAFTGNVNLSYRIAKAWSAHAGYRVRIADSAWSMADYSRHVVYVSANYTF